MSRPIEICDVTIESAGVDELGDSDETSTYSIGVAVDGAEFEIPCSRETTIAAGKRLFSRARLVLVFDDSEVSL